MRYFFLILFLSMHYIQSLLTANNLDLTYRKISIEDLLQERYSLNEIEKDSFFDYLPFPRIILCSTPSSGNSWCRYALEYLTKRPSTRYFIDYKYDKIPYFSLPEDTRTWFNAINPPWGVQFPDIGIDFSKAPILKYHDIKIVRQKEGLEPLIHSSKDKLVLIVRDYKEIYCRSYPGDFDSVEAVLGNYFNLLEFYDSYQEDRRILIYFEDLLDDPSKIFSLLLEFTNDSKEYLGEFLDQIQFHLDRCASLYNIPKHAKSLGKGKKFYYSSQFSRSALLELEKRIKEKHPIIYEKYLIKYQIDH